MILEIRGEAAFIANAGNVAVGLEDGGQGVEDFRAHAQGILEGHGAKGHDHEFLDVQVVRGMRAAIDDVHHRGWQNLGIDAAYILVKRLAQVFRSRAAAGHRCAKHGIRAEAGLVVGAVKVDKGVVYADLLQAVHAFKGLGNLVVDIGNSLGDALAAIAFFVAVAHFEGFATACGCAGRHGRARRNAAFQRNFHFNSGIAARIQNFSAIDGSNCAHGLLLLVHL